MSKRVEVPEGEARAWDHPTMPEAALNPWIVGDVLRWINEEPPEVQWIVDGLIPAGLPGILAGRAGAGKSMTALAIGLGLASGRGVLGRALSAESRRGVVFVGLEDDAAEVHRRFKRFRALLQENGQWTHADDEELSRRFIPLFPDRMKGQGFTLDLRVDSIAEHAKAIPGGCGLVILDTLARLNSGDENSAAEMRPFLEAQAQLVQATGASVLAIHHVGKGNDTPSGKALWQRLHPEAMRGSTAIEGAARFILTMAALEVGEIQKAGLEEGHADTGGLVALQLAKTSQTEKGETLLLERRHASEPGAGFLMPHPDSERALAAIRGAGALNRLNLRDKVLLALAEKGGKLGDTEAQKTAAALIWPSSSDAYTQWRKRLSELRKTGLLGDPHLSDLGWAKAETLGFRRNSQGGMQRETSQALQAVPPGTVETEQTEQNTSEFVPSVPPPWGSEQRNNLDRVSGEL